MKTSIKIKVRPDLETEFANLPSGQRNHKGHLWTMEADACLLKWWPIKYHRPFLALFSKRFFPISENPARYRYRKLIRDLKDGKKQKVINEDNIS